MSDTDPAPVIPTWFIHFLIAGAILTIIGGLIIQMTVVPFPAGKSPLFYPPDFTREQAVELATVVKTAKKSARVWEIRESSDDPNKYFVVLCSLLTKQGCLMGDIWEYRRHQSHWEFISKAERMPLYLIL